jgi:hypothetical protein
MVPSCVPFNFVENGWLQQAFSRLGVSPITRKEVSGPMLKKLSTEDRKNVTEHMKGLDFVAGSSEGWRKTFCLQGAGFMSFTVMGNSGVRFVR